MVEKGFDLKILIPTNDGLTITDAGIENASYFLLYNISNRSYQLAGKFKTVNLFSASTYSSAELNKFLENENLDACLSLKGTNTENLMYKVLFTTESDIGKALNNLIDTIDKMGLI